VERRSCRSSRRLGRCTGYSVGEIASWRKYASAREEWNALEEGRAGRAHCSALGVRALEHLENSIASASIYDQVTKGLRWMPWRQEPMKDASGCEKPRGAAEKAEIRGCPNGETRPGSCPVTQV
jgi:hypothetical protein